MRFLLSRGRHSGEPGKVLLIQTCNPNLLEYVVGDASRRWPSADITVLLQRNMRQYVRIGEGLNALDNPESGKRAFAKGLKRERFDLVALTAVRDPGFWKLKLLPLYLNPPRLVIYDRHARHTEPGLAGLWNLFGLGANRRFVLRKMLAPFMAAALAVYYISENIRRGR